MAKKIALISVYKDPNYGSILQAYALSAALTKLGYENEYIDYNSQQRSNLSQIIRKYAKCLLETLRIRKSIKTEYSYWKTRDFKAQLDLFKSFHRHYIPFSSKKYNHKNISLTNKEYVKFIIGSDQTWSPLANSKPFSLNFLEFVEDNSKKCSYAPSIGSVHIPQEYVITLKRHLSEFSFLSCRERQNAVFLTTLLNKKVTYVLDPTFLLTKNDWLEISEKIDIPEQFILCYILGTKECISKFAESLGQQKRFPVYYIVTRPESLKFKNILRNVSIGQFLFLLNHASYVITDSFHGSILSLNLGTNFYSFAKREATNSFTDNDRIMDFLTVVGLQNRFKSDDDYIFEEDIDFLVFNKVLEPLRKQSLEYLFKMVSK